MHPKEPARLRLAQLPTPMVPLNRLAAQLEIGQILLKRDDLTGLEVTGNKIRKLEYLIADALQHGCNTLVTHGGVQSNHCRATAAIGARLGLRVRLILRASAEANAANEGNFFLDGLFGADVTLHSTGEYRNRLTQLVDEAMEAERRAGRRPYFFPVGASLPLGCWGYINACAELVEQLGRKTHVDVFSAVSSGATHVGLMIGRALLGCENWRIVGVPVSDSVEYFQRELRRLERQTNDLFDLRLNESDTPIQLVDGYIGQGYAIPYPAALQTLRDLARSEGILLDPTYTAKAMTGLIGSIRNHTVRPDATLLFVHTGGVFGLMARHDLFSPERTGSASAG